MSCSYVRWSAGGQSSLLPDAIHQRPNALPSEEVDPVVVPGIVLRRGSAVVVVGKAVAVALAAVQLSDAPAQPFVLLFRAGIYLSAKKLVISTAGCPSLSFACYHFGYD